MRHDFWTAHPYERPKPAPGKREEIGGRSNDRRKAKEEEKEAKAQAKAKAQETEGVQKYLDGKTPIKVIYVPGRLVNIVTASK
jgi:leucyl-tRNA synthetase